MNPNYINNYLKQFSQINPLDVGPYINEGGQHYVFRYREDKVIKVPKRTILMRLYGLYKVADLENSDINLNEIFNGYFLDIQVLASDNRRHYLILQKYLNNAQPLKLKNFPEVKEQFLAIVKYNRELIKLHKQALDFISFRGFCSTILGTLLRQKHRAVMENLLVYSQNGKPTLKLVDANLLELKPRITKRLNPLHWFVDQFFYRSSKVLIKDNFGVDI